jgi:hypothetical protein
MPKRKARPVTVSAPQKGRSKPKCGIPLDELLAAHAAGPSVVLAKLGHVFETEIHDRLAYRRTFGAGLAIVETTDLLNKPARDEIAALFTEIWSAVNG